jgi:L-rhamnose isomerase
LVAGEREPLGQLVHVQALAGGDVFQRAADDATTLQLPDLSKRLSWLGLLANSATLIGLLGTITGLITAIAGVGEADAAKAMSLIPGRHRFSIHAIYLEAGSTRVERDQIETKHFDRWIDWAAELGIGLDFNSTLFSHPKAADGFTLCNRDAGIRKFWIDHVIAGRKIGADIGRRLNNPCVNNLWIPDGMKDVTIDRKGPRELLKSSLDEIFAAP